MSISCLRDKVIAFTKEMDLFSAPCHVLLGLSGGADSMAMLHVLSRWHPVGLRVSAVHIHHGLRVAADAEEAFVREHCSQWNIPLTVIHKDVSAIARDLHLSLEEAGRQVRYEQFEIVRAEIGADYVVTAHTANDQTETVLMHLIRGCGVDGMSGIPCSRGYIRRPLLCCSRQEVEEYCAENGIPFVVDESNLDTKYTRNDVRHRVLPLLRELNPSVDEAVLRLSKCAAEEASYLNDLACDALRFAACDDGFLLSAFVAQPAVIRRRMIRVLLLDGGVGTLTETHILDAEKRILNGGGSIDLPGFFVFSVQQGVVSLRKEGTHTMPIAMVIDALPLTVVFSEKTYSFEILDVDVHNLFLNCVVDYDKIQGTLCLRGRQSGDYLHAAGRGVGKSLKKWMNEWHIPAHLRDVYPVICDDVGVVLVPGYACDERVRVTEDTKHFLVCKTDAE